MILGYARVSQLSQTHDLQLDALKGAGAERIWTETASGARASADRPELARLLDTARSGDQICVWRLDRLCRSLRHLIDLGDQLQRRGVALRSLTENIDTSTPSGRFLFNLLGALGEMEREIIVERTRAGLAAAAARGRRGGRPPALDDAKVRAARAMLSSGNLTAVEVARQLGCAASTLYRHVPGGKSSVDQSAAA
jgi:DNA invertase Pin-like site-specific DNA recombinase